MEESIIKIMGHIATINDELGNVQTNVAVLEAQMSEVLWMLRIILGTFFIIFVKRIWKVVLKNNK